MPLDENHFHVIALKNEDAEKISSVLKMEDSRWCDWKEANRRSSQVENFDDCGYYEWAIITKQFLSWNYIFCNKLRDFKYALNCCHELSQISNIIFHFSIDVHSGEYRFIKVENGRIARFFERNGNQETGEFGQPLREELEMEGHDYFHAVLVAKKILRLDLIKQSQMTDEQVLIGKRYYREIERYTNLYLDSEEASNSTSEKKDENDLPF